MSTHARVANQPRYHQQSLWRQALLGADMWGTIKRETKRLTVPGYMHAATQSPQHTRPHTATACSRDSIATTPTLPCCHGAPHTQTHTRTLCAPLLWKLPHHVLPHAVSCEKLQGCARPTRHTAQCVRPKHARTQQCTTAQHAAKCAAHVGARARQTLGSITRGVCAPRGGTQASCHDGVHCVQAKPPQPHTTAQEVGKNTGKRSPRDTHKKVDRAHAQRWHTWLSKTGVRVWPAAAAAARQAVAPSASVDANTGRVGAAQREQRGAASV
jgi:hypothetical protein